MLRYKEWHVSSIFGGTIFDNRRYNFFFFFNDNVIRYFGFVVDSNVIIYRKAVPCYFFLNLLVKYYSRSQYSKLHLTRSQSMDKWILHFKSRGIEILTALIELLCISETNL